MATTEQTTTFETPDHPSSPVQRRERYTGEVCTLTCVDPRVDL